jgi:hypothetical protein
MAISSPYSGTMNTWADPYDGNRYYAEQERRYREEIARQQMMAMQQTQYNPYTDTYRGVSAQQMAEQPAKKVSKVEPSYLTNQKLLLLGEAS